MARSQRSLIIWRFTIAMPCRVYTLPEAPAESAPDIDLEALAYTLQVGREAMKYRAVFLVRDIAELYQRLIAFAQGGVITEGCWHGEVHQGKRAALLGAGGASQQLVARWISEDTLDKVAEAWTRGDVVDWQLFYGEDRPPRLHLPTYPFARERYEAAENLAAEAEARAVARVIAERGREALTREDVSLPEEAVEPFELMTFEEVWEEQAPAQTHVRPQTLVCFLSDPDHQHVLREMANQKVPGSRLIFIAQHGAARKPDQHVSSDAAVFHIDPLEKASYTNIFQRLRQEGAHVDAVLYLWADEDEALVQNLAPLIYILHAMAETTLSIERILCAARCHTDSLARCFLESWIGFERSLGLVWPHTPVTVVLDENGEPGVSAWLERLWLELSTSTPQSIRYQNGQRYVCRIQPTVLDHDNGEALRMGGTYLITGGCGRLGLIFARHLAENQGRQSHPHRSFRPRCREACGNRAVGGGWR